METEKPNENGDAFARREDPDTSHEAAKHMRGKRSAILKFKACEHLARAPDGLTASEIADRAGCARDSMSPRMKDLVKEGRVVDTGTTRTVHGHRAQTVWKLHPNYERPTDAT